MVLWMVWLGIGVVVGGCTAPPADAPAAVATDPLSAVPDDLTIDLRVLVAPTSSDQPSDSDVRPARIVFMPDGALHGDLDSRHAARQLPAQIRRLDRKQIAELWSRINELGLADPSRAEPMLNPLLIDQPGDGILYVLSIRASDQWWQFRRAVDKDADTNVAIGTLADELIRLAWLDARSSERAALMAPPRYHFGPDPYARYRTDDR